MMEDKGASLSPLAETIEQTFGLDVKDVLLSKRETLRIELKELDATMSLVHQECSAKLEQLQAKKKSLEEARHHVDALLRFEGYHLDNSLLNSNNSTRASVAAETSITDAVFALLEELHQPLHYKDMALKLQERNVYVPGKNPAATLLSRISRDSRFRRSTRPRGVYGLSTWRMRSAKQRRAKSRKTKKR